MKMCSLLTICSLSYCSCCNAFGGYKYCPFVEVANTSLCKHSFVDSPIFHLHVFFSQNPDYFNSSYKGTDRRKTPPTELGCLHKMKHFNTTNI